MLPYWLLFLMLGVAALVYSQRMRATPAGPVPVRIGFRKDPIFGFVVGLIILMIGFRYQVGGDWKVYLDSFDFIKSRSLLVAIAKSPNEVGYTVVNWIAGWIGAGFWLVDLVCAVPFVAGLIAIARREANPYLALAVATPLLIIVVGMGYTRQASALGFLLIGISALLNGKSYYRFLIWALIASLFHKSALLFIPLVALLIFRGRIGSVLLLLSTVAVGYFVVLPSALDRYSVGYIRNVYEAQGAIFRLALNGLAALLVFGSGKRLFQSQIESRIWRGWAMLALLSLLALFYIRSTVIVDRLSVYILPLQMFVFARLPHVLGGRQADKLLSLIVILTYATVLLVWLNFAQNARFWVPYKLYPLA